MIYPFIYVISISLSSPDSAETPGFHLIPQGFQLLSYKGLFQDHHFLQSYMNIIIVTAIGTLLGLIVLSCAAYTLSKKYFPYRNAFIFILVICMLFSGGLIPSYILIKNLGLLDSWFTLWLPSLTGVFYIIIIRNFFAALPIEMEEAAKMDGASDFTVFLKVVLPLTKPVMATIGLWLAVTSWNDWFSPYIYINTPSKETLPLVLRRYVIDGEMSMIASFNHAIASSTSRPTPKQLVASVITASMIPMLIIYPFIQRYFVKGVILGSVKE